VLCQSDGQESGFARAEACCQPRLEAEIANAATILACGREAVQLVTGASNIASNRGYVHNIKSPVSGKAQRVIVTTNPAVVVRDDATYPEMVRDFRLALDPLPEPKLPKVRCIDDIDEARQVIPEMLEMMRGQLIASDIETRGVGEGVENTGLSHTAQIVCAGFSTRAERAVVFGESVCNTGDFMRDILSKLWELDNCKYLWHNGKYDVKILRTHGINARVDEDTMLLSWCLDERPGDPESGAGGHSLEWLLKDELGWPRYEPASVKAFKKTGIIENVRDRNDLYVYNGFDTAGSLGLFEVLKARAIHDNVWDRPYKSLLIRLSEALTRIELEGNLYDVDRACDMLELEVWPKLKEQTASMRQIAQRPALNPNSPKQLETLLYDDWGVQHDLVRPKIEKIGKRSTDKWVREAMLLGLYRSKHDGNGGRAAIDRFARLLDDFKSLDTQRSRYLEGLVLKRFPNGRIYTDFKIHGTESGRISSANPNLQNITRTKEGLPNIRSCFIPDPGCVFISADLSQAELRTIAVLSGDTNLQAIYTDTGRSLHKEVAAEFYGADYTYEQYVRAKNINFGVAYWQSAFGFAQMYHMPREEAQGFIDFWWKRFPQVWEWTKQVEKEVMEVGELQSPFGHKRRFYVIPADESARIHTIKQGINFRPQNVAANITLWALCNICDKLDWSRAQPRITIHDSILVNCREKYVDEVASLIKVEMELAAKEAIGWDFPYLADLSVGSNWGDMHEL
jgi:DNA polymerase-1